MVQFFGKFGEKPCCITDLILYLHLLAPEQHVQVKSEYVALADPSLQRRNLGVHLGSSSF